MLQCPLKYGEMFFKFDIFCSCFTFGQRMIDPDCERKRFVETLEDPRAVTALVGVVVVGMVWYGMVWYGCGCCYFYSESAPVNRQRGSKAEAINFYGYCLTNANAINVFTPSSFTEYLASQLVMKRIDGK